VNLQENSQYLWSEDVGMSGTLEEAVVCGQQTIWWRSGSDRMDSSGNRHI